MSKVRIEGATEKDGKAYCDNCNSDLSVEGSVEMAYHADGAKEYIWAYKCQKCGNIIKTICQRSAAGAVYWE